MKIPLGRFGAEFRLRAPPVPLPGTAPNVVDVVWYFFLLLLKEDLPNYMNLSPHEMEMHSDPGTARW